MWFLEYPVRAHELEETSLKDPASGKVEGQEAEDGRR
jgi:hypothetical protein